MKLFKALILTILLYIAVILTIRFLFEDTPSVTGEVVGKYEDDSKCYVDLLIEVPIEDYIGLDIGDEYEIR